MVPSSPTGGPRRANPVFGPLSRAGAAGEQAAPSFPSSTAHSTPGPAGLQRALSCPGLSRLWDDWARWRERSFVWWFGVPRSQEESELPRKGGGGGARLGYVSGWPSFPAIPCFSALWASVLLLSSLQGKNHASDQGSQQVKTLQGPPAPAPSQVAPVLALFLRPPSGTCVTAGTHCGEGQ